MNSCTIFRSSLTLLLLIFISGFSHPQVQISQQEFLKVIAPNTFHYYTEPVEGSFNIGRPGGPNIYNFSFLNIQSLLISNNYLAGTIPLIAARYPSSAIVFGDSPTTIENNPVFYISNDSVFIAGDASLVPQYRFRHYSPYELLAVFPVSYGDSFSMNVTAYDTLYDNNWQVITATSNVSLEETDVDGFGTLVLPNGSYECLRLRKEYTQSEGGDKEFIFLTREGALLIVGGVSKDDPDTGLVNAGMQLLLPEALVGIDDEENYSPSEFSLEQNYPNPFNPSTKIYFNLPSDATARLTVYNLLGEKTVELLNSYLTAGRHSVTFNASGYPGGVYFYSLESNGSILNKKMLLIK
jgi:hypothetical protein